MKISDLNGQLKNSLIVTSRRFFLFLKKKKNKTLLGDEYHRNAVFFSVLC